MTVRQRANRWVVDFTYLDEAARLKRFRRSLGPTVRTKRQAEKEESRLRAEFYVEEQHRLLGAGQPRELPAAAFSGFAKKWYDTHVVVNCKPSVRDRYESILRVHLVPYFGDRDIAGVSALDVEEFKATNSKTLVEKTGEPLAPKTVNEHLGVLSSMFEAGVRWGYLHNNPCRRVQRLKLPVQQFAFYDAKQTEVFLAKALELEPAHHAMFVTGFRTGMRLGEMLGLEWDDVDLAKRRLHLKRSFHRGNTTTPKSGKSRIIPMPPSLVDVLKAHRHLKGDLVFSRPDGSHLNRDILKHPWNRVLTASGLHRIRLHDMRHSFASQLVLAGVPLKVVAELLGHSETRITERYAHFAPAALHSFVDVLDGKTTGRRTAAGMPGWWKS